MADVENQQESSSFPVKRKSDLYHQEQDNNVANKSQKLNATDYESKDGEINETNVEETITTVLPEKESENVSGDLEAEEKEEEEEVEAVIERRGSISREDKGKGKMIEVEESEEEDSEEDSDDDDDDCGDEFDDESDLSDDPLAEVDLENILPSRTRRRSIQPGVYISNETRDRGVSNVEEEEEEEDSDDDSDA